MSRARRAYHAGLAGAGRGASVRLSDQETHHVQRVLRLRAGDALRLFDGEGREWSGVLVECRPAGAVVQVGEEIGGVVESPFDVELYQGLGRHDRVEWAIQKATEVGVRSITVVLGARTAAPAPTRSRLERWRRVALEACKQSGRRLLPDLRVVDELPTPERGVSALLLDPGPASEPLAVRLAGPRPEAAWVAAGPEGGFSGSEADRAVESGWARVGLGPRVLRTETAGPVAAALVLHRWGDLGSESASAFDGAV